MKITGHESEWAILKELGKRIKEHRIALNMTQMELAKKCNISISTETRIENGDDSKMSNYIRIMEALGILENLDVLIPEAKPDYKAIFEERPARKRVRTGNKQTKSTWVWGEDR